MTITTMREAIRRGLKEALDNDPRVLIIGEDIGLYGGAYAITDGFLKEYGEKRIKDAPISEAGFVGAGVGAAAAGLRPIVELMSISFSLVAFDQLVNMAANIRYMSGGQIKVPLVIRAPTGAGSQLAATHSQSFETWLAEVPGMRCMSPSNPGDALGLLRSAIKDPNPVIFAEPASLYSSKGEVPDAYYEIPIGSADVKVKGDDLTLISYGAGLPILLDAAEMMRDRGISAEVIDLRSLNPVDLPTLIRSARKTHRIILLETARRLGGIMAEIASNLQEKVSDWLDGPVVRLGAADVPWPYSRVLEQASLPKPQKVLEAVNTAFNL